MIKLLQLKFQNIGRFTDLQQINFSNKGKLLQFDGKNENTGGSSGSGKSTVFAALDLLLGLNGATSSSLQSRLTKSGFLVEGEFEINGLPITVTRSKKDGLTVKTPSETIEGNVKMAEEKLDALIGIPRKLFGKMVHKKQKEGGFFLELTAKESYDFMVDCLGLQEWESKLEKISSLIKSKELEILQLEGLVKNDQESLGKYTSDLASVKKPDSIDEEALQNQRSICLQAIASTNQQIENAKSFLKERLEGLEKQKQTEIPAKPEVDILETLDEQHKQLGVLATNEVQEKSLLNTHEIDEKIKNGQTVLISISQKEIEVKNLISKINELKQQKEHIESTSCPTCSQTWTGESAQKKIEEISSKINVYKSQVLEMRELLAKKDVVTVTIEKLKLEKEEKERALAELTVKYAQQRASLNNQIQNLNNKQNQALLEWSMVKMEIEKKYAEEIKQAEKAAADIIGVAQEAQRMNQNDILRIESTLREYAGQLKSYEQMTATINLRIKELSEKINQNESKVNATRKQLLIASEAHRAIKSYTLQIFQDTLNFIGEYATQILNAVPAMANATLYFENCKETKTGKIKDEINCIINLDGENDINIKTLSGGERTAVDLAVDLAVIEVLESQTGKGADWIVLDEPFTGLDSVGCEAAIDIIKQIGLKKRIIVVDHNPEVKEVIEESITVHRKGLESSIVGG